MEDIRASISEETPTVFSFGKEVEAFGGSTFGLSGLGVTSTEICGFATLGISASTTGELEFFFYCQW